MKSSSSVSEPSPLRMLLLALLAAVLLAQLAAMAYVAHSQVERAAQRDAAERVEVAAQRQAMPAMRASTPEVAGNAGTAGSMVKVGYAFPR